MHATNAVQVLASWPSGQKPKAVQVPLPKTPQLQAAPTSPAVVLAASSGEARQAASCANWASCGACSTGPSCSPAAAQRCSAEGVAAMSVSPSAPAHASCIAGCGSGPSRRASLPAWSRMWMCLCAEGKRWAASCQRQVRREREAGGQPKRPGTGLAGFCSASGPRDRGLRTMETCARDHRKSKQKVLTPRARRQQTPCRLQQRLAQLLAANPEPAQPSLKGSGRAQAPDEQGNRGHGRRRAGRLRWLPPGCQAGLKG